jgi:murein DD-endopeptidase MepM/ murein hydrolase activator NlpD
MGIQWKCHQNLLQGKLIKTCHRSIKGGFFCENTVGNHSAWAIVLERLLTLTMKRYAAFLLGVAIALNLGATNAQELPPLDATKYLPEAEGYIMPAAGILSSGYGWRWGKLHRGIDIASDIGTPIYAAADGVVEYAGWNSSGYGNMIEIRHSDGSMTRYAHADRLLAAKGTQVEQGEVIAEMGATGFSTGPHLHFEVHLPGKGTVNPLAYLYEQ